MRIGKRNFSFVSNVSSMLVTHNINLSSPRDYDRTSLKRTRCKLFNPTPHKRGINHCSREPVSIYLRSEPISSNVCGNIKASF